MRGRVVIDSPEPPLNLGIGHRSPIMANGQKPGIPRAYDLSYVLVLMEQQGPVAR